MCQYSKVTHAIPPTQPLIYSVTGHFGHDPFWPENTLTFRPKAWTFWPKNIDALAKKMDVSAKIY